MYYFHIFLSKCDWNDWIARNDWKIFHLCTQLSQKFCLLRHEISGQTLLVQKLRVNFYTGIKIGQIFYRYIIPAIPAQFKPCAAAPLELLLLNWMAAFCKVKPISPSCSTSPTSTLRDKWVGCVLNSSIESTTSSLGSNMDDIFKRIALLSTTSSNGS